MNESGTINKPYISYKRHLAKTITWRIIASLTTFVLALLFFKDDPSAEEKAAGVAAIESVLKMIIYYGHERVWYKINAMVRVISKKRHIIKSITWRILASFTTFVVTLLVFRGEVDVLEKASVLMLVEAVIKLVIYYGHERVWYKLNFGVEHPRKSTDTDQLNTD